MSKYVSIVSEHYTGYLSAQRFETEHHQIEDQLGSVDLVDTSVADHIDTRIGSEDKPTSQPEPSEGEPASDIPFSDADRQIM